MSPIAMGSSRERRKSPENKALPLCSICMLEDPPAHPSPVTHEYPGAERALRCLIQCLSERRIHRSDHRSAVRSSVPTRRRETRRETYRRLHRTGRRFARRSDRPPTSPCIRRPYRTAAHTPAQTAMRLDERVGIQKAMHMHGHHDAQFNGHFAMRIAAQPAMQVAGQWLFEEGARMAPSPLEACAESASRSRRSRACSVVNGDERQRVGGVARALDRVDRCGIGEEITGKNTWIRLQARCTGPAERSSDLGGSGAEGPGGGEGRCDDRAV